MQIQKYYFRTHHSSAETPADVEIAAEGEVDVTVARHVGPALDDEASVDGGIIEVDGNDLGEGKVRREAGESRFVGMRIVIVVREGQQAAGFSPDAPPAGPAVAARRHGDAVRQVQHRPGFSPADLPRGDRDRHDLRLIAGDGVPEPRTVLPRNRFHVDFLGDQRLEARFGRDGFLRRKDDRRGHGGGGLLRLLSGRLGFLFRFGLFRGGLEFLFRFRF